MKNDSNAYKANTENLLELTGELALKKQQKIGQIQYDLLQKLSKLEAINGSLYPTSERIEAVFDALKKIGEEKSVFQDYMFRTINELKRAIYLKVGEFPVLFNYQKIQCEGIKSKYNLL